MGRRINGDTCFSGPAAVLRVDAVRVKAGPWWWTHIDFNRIYKRTIKPGIEDAEMFRVHAD
jgi:hypothetical protein